MDKKGRHPPLQVLLFWFKIEIFLLNMFFSSIEKFRKHFVVFFANFLKFPVKAGRHFVYFYTTVL